MSSRKFTWCNNHEDPLLEKLDRVLVSTAWELQYPLVTVQSLVRALSDYSALLLDTGHNIQSQNHFKFELCWLTSEGFFDLVRENWLKPVKGGSSLDKWQTKIRRLRGCLNWWNRNLEGIYKNLKKNCMLNLTD